MDFKLRQIEKKQRGKPILTDISFDVAARELVSIVGPSGVGKTTLLNIIAGLDRPDRGEVIFSRPPDKGHPVIMVFQDYVLFPSMTVRDNIGFGLSARHRQKEDIKKNVDKMLEYFQLGDQAGHYPAQLSAGQKQRVAIARAMVVNPGVLLLDEPFANLDRNLKMETARFIKKTQKEFGIPTVSVTHDLEEAFAMSDRIGVLLGGRLEQIDTPEQVYFNACSRKVAEFLGPVNPIPKHLFSLFGVMGNRSGEVLARPENLLIEPSKTGMGTITEKNFAGHYFAYGICIENKSYTVYCQDDRFSLGQQVSLKLKTL